MSTQFGRAPNLEEDLNITEEELQNLANEYRNTQSEEERSGSSWKEPESYFRVGAGINKLIKERYHNYVEKLRTNSPKILLVGDTGLGKSSLINIVFDMKLGVTDKHAQVSHGEPCTEDFELYGPYDSSPVRIIDSKGVEKLLVKDQIVQIMDYILLHAQSTEDLDHVHLVYYFAGMNRWQKADTEYVRQLQKHCGIIIVLNKRDQRTDDQVRALREVIRRDFPNIDIAECGDPRGTNNWIPDSCKDGHGEDHLDIRMKQKTWSCDFPLSIDSNGVPVTCSQRGDDQPFGHNELVRTSLKLLPELIKPAFQTAQRVDMNLRHIRAGAVILTATGLAAGVGAVPIPFSDIPLLLAIEGLMASSLMVVYGVPLETFDGQALLSLNTGIIGIGGFLGYLSAQILKFVPVLGTAAGGTIDMAIAGTVVLTLGVSIAAVLTEVVKQGQLSESAETFKKIMDVVQSTSGTDMLGSVVSTITGGNSNGQTNTAIAKIIGSIVTSQKKKQE